MTYGKAIGVGNTAVVYEWGADKVLKLFNEGYPREAAEMEFSNTNAIRSLDFNKPKAYELINLDGRIGIIYDRAEGEPLTEWVMKTGDLHRCAIHMATLHKSVLKNQVSGVPNYKDFLRYNIKKALPADSHKLIETLHLLDTLKDGNTLCHGDFHPGNILMSDDQPKIIDFMNICHGHYLYDIARTVFLVEYTPVPAEVEEKDTILEFKRSLTDLYLTEMNVTRDMIRDYLSVIRTARLGECPNEPVDERN